MLLGSPWRRLASGKRARGVNMQAGITADVASEAAETGGDVAIDCVPVQDTDKLPMVVAEIIGLMEASAAMMTSHAQDNRLPTTLLVALGLDEAMRTAMLAICTAVRTDFVDGHAFWRPGPTGSNTAILMMPIEQVIGHSRLLLSVLFDQPSREAKERAEELYRTRRPFATGYFQLWQTNRVQTKRLRAVEAVLNQADFGIVLFDHTTKVVFANRAMNDILDKRNGIERHEDRLRATHASADFQLQAKLRDVADRGRSTASSGADLPLLALRRKNAPFLIAAALPADGNADQFNDVAGTLYVLDPQIDMTRALLPLGQVYGFSRAELRLACHLASGETLMSAATQMDVKVPTARGHLRQLLVKTATRHQTELVALMLASLMRMKQESAGRALV